MNDRDLGPALDRDLDRARDLLNLHLDLDLGPAFDRDLGPAFDRDFGLTFDRALDRARDLNLTRDLALGRILDLALALARVLAAALGHVSDIGAEVLTDTRALARVLDSVLDRVVDLDSVPDIDSVLEIDRALNPVFAGGLDLAGELARVLAEKLDLQNTEGFASALLAGALDDFSRTDLSGIDLTAVDLVGLRWSERDTRWPPGTNVEHIRSASEETEPGSGIFVITRRGGTDRNRAKVRV
jgi:hypothetical protein